MTQYLIKSGEVAHIADGSRDKLQLVSISNGGGLIHIGEPSPDGFDVPFVAGDRVIVPANEPATLRANSFVVECSVGDYGAQVFSGGIDILPTQAIISDGQTLTASTGQTVAVAVANNEPTIAVKNWALWNPFTVTANLWEDGPDLGYLSRDFTGGDPVGSITNEPVREFVVRAAYLKQGAEFLLNIAGPHAIAEELRGANVKIDDVDYAPTELSSKWDEELRMWVTEVSVPDVTPWSEGQNIPIVITPQNGG